MFTPLLLRGRKARKERRNKKIRRDTNHGIWEHFRERGREEERGGETSRSAEL